MEIDESLLFFNLPQHFNSIVTELREKSIFLEISLFEQIERFLFSSPPTAVSHSSKKPFKSHVFKKPIILFIII